MNDDYRKLLYGQLASAGYGLPDLDTFSKQMLDPINRRNIYDLASAPEKYGLPLEPVDLGDFYTFESKIVDSYYTPERLQERIKTGDLPESKVMEKANLLENVINANALFKPEETAITMSAINGLVQGAIGLANAVVSDFVLAFEDPKTLLESIALQGSDASGVPSAMRVGERLAFAEKVNKKQNEGELKNYQNVIEYHTKMGQEIRKLLDVPLVEKTFWNNEVPAAFGSSAFFLAVGALAPASLPGMLTASLTGALVEQGMMSIEAFEETGDLGESILSGARGIAIGATEGVPIGNWLNRIKGKPSLIKNLFKSKSPLTKQLLTSTIEGTEEFIQESFQTFAENVNAKDLWDVNRDLTQGVLEGGMAGFISGFLMSGLATAIGPGDDAKTKAAEDMARKLRAIAPKLEEIANTWNTFNENKRTMNLDENLIATFGKNADKIKESVKLTDEFLEIKKTVPEDDLALAKLYDEKPEVFLEGNVVEELFKIKRELPNENTQVDQQSKEKIKRLETRGQTQRASQTERAPVIQREIEPEDLKSPVAYDDEIYDEVKRKRPTLIPKGTEVREVQFEDLRKDQERRVNWKVNQVLERNDFPPFKMEKKASFNNYLKKFIPQYQIDYITNQIEERLQRTNRTKMSKEEIASIVQESFPLNYRAIESRADRHKGYASFPPGDNYFEQEFIHPNALENVRKNQIIVSESSYTIDEFIELAGDKDVIASRFYSFLSDQEKFNRTAKILENRKKLGPMLELLKKLNYRITDPSLGADVADMGIQSAVLDESHMVFLDPVLKLVNGNVLLNYLQENSYTEGIPEAVYGSIIDSALLYPLEFAYGGDTENRMAWRALRVNDLKNNRTTREQFTPVTLDVENYQFKSMVEQQVVDRLAEERRIQMLKEGKDPEEISTKEQDDFTREVQKQLPAELKKAQEDAVKLYLAFDALLETILNPQTTGNKLKFKEILDYIKEFRPLAYEFLQKAKGSFALTGSLSLSAFGRVIRKEIIPHDFDFRIINAKPEEVFADEIASGRMMEVNRIVDEEERSQTQTFKIVPKGYTIGKVPSGIVIVGPEGIMQENEVEVIIADFFDSEMTLQQRPLVDREGFKLVDPRDTFQAKMSMQRVKDVIDLALYQIEDPSFYDRTFEDVAPVNSLKGHHYGRVGQFGWVRGDSITEDNQKIGRVHEIQSDLYREGRTDPSEELDPIASVFMKGVSKFDFTKLAILDVVGRFSREGINKVRFPYGNTVRDIEGYGQGELPKNQQAVIDYYSSKVLNTLKKLFKNVEIVKDKNGSEWVEVTTEKQPADLEEMILFEKPTKGNPEVTVKDYSYNDILGKTATNSSVEDVIKELERQGLVNEKTKPVVDWMIKKSDIRIEFGNNETVLSKNKIDNQPVKLNGRNAAYIINKTTGEQKIVVNLDAKGSDQDIYNTIAHELFHHISVSQLKTNRQFRLEIEALMNEVKENFERDGLWDDDFEVAFASPEEFLAHVVGDTRSEIRDYMYKTTIPGKPKYIQRLISILRQLWQNLLGKGPSTYGDALEILLREHLGAPTEFTRIPSSEISPTYMIDAESIQESTDKAFLLTKGSYDDPKVVATISKMIQEKTGAEVSDHIAYIQSLSLEQVVTILGTSAEFKQKAMHHYNERYNDVFEEYEDYEEAIIRQVYQQAMNLEKTKRIRLVKTTHKYIDGRDPEELFEVEELGFYYKDKNNNSKTSYAPRIPMFEVIPIIEKIFGVKFEVTMGEELKQVNVFHKGKDEAPDVKTHWESIAQYSERRLNQNMEVEQFQNQRLDQELSKAGYLYLGNWSDKKTIVMLKAQGTPEQMQKFKDTYEAIDKAYAEKAISLRDNILRAAFKAQGKDPEIEYNRLLALAEEKSQDEERVVSLSEIIADLSLPEGFPSGKDLAEYTGSANSPAQILRAVLEDIRLGGKFVGNEFRSALFEGNDSNTFDAIKLYKRPYLISQKSYVDQTGVGQIIKDLGLNNDKYGFVVKNGKLYVRAFVYNGEVAPDTKVTYKDKEIDLHKMLVNRMGIARTDGRVQFVLGSFDKVWRKLHGALKTGALKFWIGNNFEGDFTNPFYVKGAGHGNSANELTSQWMMENKIGLLISSTAAKINKNSRGNLFQENPETFLIPFENIYRDMEKGKAEKEAKGLQQSLLANWLTKINPAYPLYPNEEEDPLRRIIDRMTDNLVRRFKQDMMGLDATGIIDFFREKALNSTTSYEKAISAIVLDLTMTEADAQYKRLKDYLSAKPVLTKEDQKRLVEAISQYKTKKVRMSKEVADKILNIFHEPYFAEAFKSKISKELEKATYFQVPSAWGTLDYDGGNLFPERIAQVRKYAEFEWRSRNLGLFYAKKRREFEKIQALMIELQRKEVELNAQIEGSELNDKIVNLMQQRENVRTNLAKYDEIVEKFDEEGRYRATKQEIEETLKPPKEAVDEIMNEVLDENGFLKPGNLMISEDIADFLKLNTGDLAVNGVIPSDSILSLGGVRIVAILPEGVAEAGKIIGNSEDIQGIRGKDFDIDTMFLFGASDMFTKEEIATLKKALEDSMELHKTLMVREYRRVLNGERFRINGRRVNGEDLTFDDTFDKEVRLKFVQSFNGERLGKRLYNPVKDNFRILNEYTKDIGKIVNRRKLVTVKSQIGFSTRVGNVTINPDHRRKFSTYNILMNQTNDMVDVPTNTNKFFYNYDPVTAYNQDYGTSFDPNEDEDQFYVRVLTDLDEFLFKYGARLTTDYNLDERDELRELDDELKYYAVQGQINRLIKDGRKDELIRMFEKWWDSRQYDIRPFQLERNARRVLQEMRKGMPAGEFRDKFDGWMGRIKENPHLSVALAKYMLEEGKKEIPDFKKFIKENQEYKDKLLEIIAEYRESHGQYIGKISTRALAMDIARQYIDNMEVKDINGSPIMAVINKIDLTSIPSLQMDVNHYTVTHTEAILGMLNRPEWASIKQRFEQAIEKYKGHFNLRNAPLYSKGEYNNNTITLGLHYLTGDNILLHYLKAKVITMVNPVIQKAGAPSIKHGKYYSDIYQAANEWSYPRLFRILLEHNKTMEFSSMDKVEIRDTPFGPMTIGPGTNNVLTFDLTKQKVAFTAESLLEENTELAKQLREYLFGDFLKKAGNRVAISKIIAIGGDKTPVNRRIEQAAQLIKDELYKFNPTERFLFWLSFYGRPNGMPTPVNLTINKGEQFGVDRMMQLIGEVGDPQAMKIFQTFAEDFNKAFVGPSFNQSIAVKRLAERPDVFNTEEDIEVYFEDAMPEAEEETDSFADNFKTIYKLIADEPTFEVGPAEVVGTVVDIVNGEFKDLNAIDAMNAITAHVTRTGGAINNTSIALAKAIAFQESMNTFASIMEIQNYTIERHINDLTTLVKESKKDEKLKPAMAKQYKMINLLREKNPYKIQMSRGVNGYLIHYADGKYEDTPKNVETIIDLIGITDPKAKIRFKIALEFMKRYHIDNVNVVNNFIGYLEDVIRNKPQNFASMEQIKSMLKKYKDLRAAMNSYTDFNYFPRVFTKEKAAELHDKEVRGIIEKRVRKMVEEQLALKAAGANKKYILEPYASLVTEDMIKAQIEKEISIDKERIIKNSFKNYVHTWQLKRKFPKEYEGYLVESFTGDTRHLRQFHDMILADGMYLNYLEYEYAAAMKGASKSDIRKVKRFFGAIANHKMLRGKTVPLKSVKADDRIRFFYREFKYNKARVNYYSGEVERRENGYIYLKMDKETYKQNLSEKMSKNIAQGKEIKESGKATKPILYNQKQVISMLVSEGYLQNVPKNLNRGQAVLLIQEGYTKMFNDSPNWGRFDESSIFVKEYEKGKLTEFSGVTKEPKFKASDEFLRTVQALSSGTLLGTPAAGVRNFIDASWALARDLRLKRYFKNFRRAYAIQSRFKNFVRLNDPAKILEEVKGFKENIGKYVEDTLALENIVEKIAYKYALEHSLLRIDSLGNMVLNEEEVEAREEIKNLLNKIGQGIKVSSSVLLKPFKKVETVVRMQAAYMYAHKAIVEDKLTNLEEIELAITKGIGRTQSLYEAMYRRLGEDNTLGKLLFQFSQFNGFQLNTKIMEYKQAKRLGFKFSDAFKREIAVRQPDGSLKIHRAGETVDPNIMNRMLVDWWLDTIGISLGVLVPGFRATNPVTAATALPISFIAQMIVSGDTPDDWDLRDWIFGLLGFFLGVGFTLPIQILANVSGKLGAPIPVLTDPRIDRLGMMEAIAPISPRLPKVTALTLAEFFSNGRKDLSSATYTAMQGERLLLGFNYLFPYTRRYQSSRQNKFSKQDPFTKTLMLPLRTEIPFTNERIEIPLLDIPLPMPNLEQLIPIWNIIKDK